MIEYGVSLALMTVGIACILLSIRHKEPGKRLISFENSFNPAKWRPKFRDATGHRLMICGSFMLSLDGLFHLIYRWLIA